MLLKCKIWLFTYADMYMYMYLDITGKKTKLGFNKRSNWVIVPMSNKTSKTKIHLPVYHNLLSINCSWYFWPSIYSNVRNQFAVKPV